MIFCERQYLHVLRHQRKITLTFLETLGYLLTWVLYHLKLNYGVNYDILLFILAPGYTVSTWGCVVLLFMTGTGVKPLSDTQVNFSLVKELTLVLLDPELTLVLLIQFLKTLDPD